MKPKVYKSSYNKVDTIEFLSEKGYQQFGETKVFDDEKVNFSFFLEIHDKKLPAWLPELLSFFDVEEDVSDSPKQYNSIIVVETGKSVYLLPNGHGFWTVDKICDVEFGLDFGEKTVKPSDISLKGVSYVQRNKMRGVTNFKKEQNEFPQASESYFSISAKPEAENVFGKNIDCGTAVGFSKNYILIEYNATGEEGNYIESFAKLFNQIDEAMNSKNKSTFPRLRKIKKNDELTVFLDQQLLFEILNNEENYLLYFDLNKIQLIGNRIEILDLLGRTKIYISGDKKNTEKEIFTDVEDVVAYLKENADKINSVNDILFSIQNENGDEIQKDIKFKQLMYCEIEKDSQVYLLDNGLWGYFNNRFYELLEERLNEIDQIVQFDSKFDIEYISADKGELQGEGGYIEEICKWKDFQKLHKRNVPLSNVSVEIADFFNRKNLELFAVKRSTETATAIYSFEQSVLSMQVLANKKEFNLKRALLSYNARPKYDAKRFPNLTAKMVEEIVKCKKSSVLWLVDDKVKYIYNGVISKTLKLKNLNSILLKLKIVDWYVFTKENNFEPRLYFALDKPEKTRK